MSAYLAIPQTRGPWPGVLVVHDALGMSMDQRPVGTAGEIVRVRQFDQLGGLRRSTIADAKFARRGGELFEIVALG